MAKDYAKPMASKKPGLKRGAHPPSGTTTPPSKWLIFLVLTATFGLGCGLYYLNTIPPSTTETTVSQAPAPINAKKPAIPTPVAPEDTKPGFEFYKLLPESSVTTSPVDAYKPDPSKPKVKFDYILQTGSFRKPEDAEKQKAIIGFQGLRADVRRVTNKEGSAWYRVEVGPYTSRSKMNSAMDKLVAINIQPLVRKTPQKSN